MATPTACRALTGGGRAAVGLFVLVCLFGFGGRAPTGQPPAPASAPWQHDFRGKTFRLLVVGDPFARALKQAKAELEKRSGASIELEVASYNSLRRQILRNAKDAESGYDIVSFDVVWLGELAKAKALSPLQLDRSRGLNAGDFLPMAMQQSRLGAQQLGLPIQPHPELLWARQDLLAQAGLSAPVTTDDLLKVAKALTRPKTGQYGLCWNGQRGQALGHQMAHFYGAFGQGLLDANGRPALNTPRGLAAARFAKALLAVSPPGVLTMAWDQRVQSFARGECALTYGWAARSYLVEQEQGSLVAGQVTYLPPPHAPHVPALTPLGTWSLGVPPNLGAKRADAEAFLLWLSEPAQQHLLAEAGNGGMPRLSLLNDKELRKMYPAFAVVSQLSQAHALSDAMRPAVPQWAKLTEIMGTVFHDMLRGELTPEAATALAQKRALGLWVSERP